MARIDKSELAAWLGNSEIAIAIDWLSGRVSRMSTSYPFPFPHLFLPLLSLPRSLTSSIPVIPFPRTRFSSPFRFPSPWSRSSSSASSTFIFFSKQMKSGRHRPWREPFLTFTPIFFQTFPFRETFLARVLSIALLSGRPRNLKQWSPCKVSSSQWFGFSQFRFRYVAHARVDYATKKNKKTQHFLSVVYDIVFFSNKGFFF